jgi:hypothetical protein
MDICTENTLNPFNCGIDNLNLEPIIIQQNEEGWPVTSPAYRIKEGDNFSIINLSSEYVGEMDVGFQLDSEYSDFHMFECVSGACTTMADLVELIDQPIRISAEAES